MAKRGRKPKYKTIDDLEPTTRAEVDEAILSRADESAANIFRRFGLSQRGLLLDTFMRYVRKTRLANSVDRPPPAERAAPTWEEIERRVLAGMLERLDAGDTKMYELATVIGRRHERSRLDIDVEANRRAQEKHDEWKKEVEKSIRSTLDDESKAGKKSFTREDVYDMIDKVMRGA